MNAVEEALIRTIAWDIARAISERTRAETAERARRAENEVADLLVKLVEEIRKI